MHRRCPNSMGFFLSRLFGLADFQEMPNNTRVGLFPGLRSKNTASHRTWPPDLLPLEALSVLRLYAINEPFFCKPTISPVMGCHIGAHPFHPLVPFL